MLLFLETDYLWEVIQEGNLVSIWYFQSLSIYILFWPDFSNQDSFIFIALIVHSDMTIIFGLFMY